MRAWGLPHHRRPPDNPSVITFTVVIERKADSLPAFVVLAEERLAAWKLQGTTIVEVSLAGVDIGRRSLKRWPERSGWFVDLTASHLEAAGVSVGDRVTVELRRASTELPHEIQRLLDSDEEAKKRWEALSAARRRMICEHVREAKQAATRERRARKALGPPAFQ